MSLAEMWAGEFGDRYTERNRVDWSARLPFWREVLGITKARSVIEFGCNAGWNLMALGSIDPALALKGIDVNEGALAEAEANGLDVENVAALEATFDESHDLAFTAGLLIHVPRLDLFPTMKRVAAASRTWVLAIEYAAHFEEALAYRGHESVLWRRPYGYYYESMGFTQVRQGFVSRNDGFDDCTWWLFAKD